MNMSYDEKAARLAHRQEQARLKRERDAPIIAAAKAAKKAEQARRGREAYIVPDEGDGS